MNTQLIHEDAEAAHKLYKERGGRYGRTGGFMNRGPERAIDRKLWNECMAQVTGPLTLTERAERYK